MYNPFENEKVSVGQNIKIIAFVMWFLEVISGIITGIGIMVATYDYMWVGIIVIILSPFFASVSTILLYAFGAMVDKVYSIEEKIDGLKIQKSDIVKKENTPVKKEKNIKKKEEVTSQAKKVVDNTVDKIKKIKAQNESVGECLEKLNKLNVYLTCPECGLKQKATDLFCEKCGHNFEQMISGKIEDLNSDSYFADVVCPECDEEQSFPIIDIVTNKKLVCYNCDKRIW